MKNFFLQVLVIILSFSCKPSSNSDATFDSSEEGGEYIEYSNSPAEGFNQEGSDLLATLLADKVMNAMGGREAWDDTRYIAWNFLGRRTHVWDKLKGDVRIEEASKDLTILMNIYSQEGSVRLKGEALTNTDSLKKYLDLGNEYWTNDAYWLVMPYKLKDSGVTLTYVGEDTTKTGARADVIRMTFEDVGVTPENVYDVWVDVDSKLVTQWAYYVTIDQEEPRFVTPWEDYKKYGKIMLSGNRGDYELSDIQVMTEVPTGTFSSFDEIVP